MAGTDFKNANPNLPDFDQVNGLVLLQMGEITRDDFDFVGEVQKRTQFIAMVHDKYPGKREEIEQKFPKLNMSSAMFGYDGRKQVIADLDAFIGALEVEKQQELYSSAVQIVDKAAAGQGETHPNAVASAVLLKKFVLSKDEGGDVLDAILIMQMGVRALKRIEACANWEFDRVEANRLMNLHNKLNFEWDSAATRAVNTALRGACNNEIAMHEQVLDDIDNSRETDLDEFRLLYEAQTKNFMKKVLGAMPKAIGIFRQHGRDKIADEAQRLHTYFAQELNRTYLLQKPEDTRFYTNWFGGHTPEA